ncbi:tRNA-dihydrouridine(16/17) synthase [NAD(P)(+)] [Malassezia sp. CBS 17886]|nr:tRNA-dihydrouridine(16/17) synthase [NAD(P)(+)] [Malassezia sp. CBS 17886]
MADGGTGGGAEVPALSSFPATGTPVHAKLGGYDLYRALGSPKRIVAPMVDQSELAWRVLSRRYGADLVYSPMINAKIYVQKNKGAHRVRESFFNQEMGEEGAVRLSLGTGSDTDRPLIVQFCANDAGMLLEAAERVQGHCDAVDLNLGCPQHIARRGFFGAFLQDDWQLVFRLINTLHLQLRVPVTAKFRVYESVEKTVAYAKMIERAGAQMVSVHGRTREMKGHNTGLADWAKIRAVKEALSIPVFANGNMLYPQDWRDALAYTRCDGVMSAEGNLYNPTLFHDEISHDLSRLCDVGTDRSGFGALHIARIAHEYLDIVAALRTPTPGSALKGHMFKITRPALALHTDLRAALGRARTHDDKQGDERVEEYRSFVNELQRRLAEDEREPAYYKAPPDAARYYVTPAFLQDPADESMRPAHIPHWYLQPYFRPPLNPPKSTDGAGGDSTRAAENEVRTELPAAADGAAATVKAAPQSPLDPGELPPKRARTEVAAS